MPVLIALALVVLTFQVGHLIKGNKYMSKQISALQADVANNTTVVGSAVALLGSLSQQLKDAIAAMNNGDDGAALDALSTALEANTNSLAQAVAANTPGLTGSASDSTPVHPATDLPGTPDAGSAHVDTVTWRAFATGEKYAEASLVVHVR